MQSDDCKAGSPGGSFPPKTVQQLRPTDPRLIRQCGSFFQAIRQENLQEVLRLIEGGVDVNLRGEEKLTPLQVAASIGSVDVCQALISNGARLEIEDGEFSALHYAVSGRHPLVCDFLCSSGANVLLRDDQGRTALDVVDSCDVSIIARLEQEAKVLASREESTHQPPASPEERINNENTRIPKQAQIERKADRCPSIQRQESQTLRRRKPQKELLLEEFSPLQIAAKEGNVAACKKLIEEEGVLLEAEDGAASSLHYAVVHNRTGVVQYLLTKGANVLLRDARFNTPLEVALMRNAPRPIIVLLQDAENATAASQVTEEPLPLSTTSPQCDESQPSPQNPAASAQDLEQQYLAKQAKLEGQVDELKVSLAKAEEWAKQSLAEQARLRESEKACKVELESLRRRIELDRVFKDRQKGVAALISNNFQLTAQLEDCQKELTSVRAELSGKCSEVSDMQNEMRARVAMDIVEPGEIFDVSGECEDKSKVSETENGVQERAVEAELADLRAALQTSRSNEDALRRTVHWKDKALHALGEQIEEQDSLIHKINKLNETLEQNVHATVDKMEQANLQVERWRQSCEALKVDVETAAEISRKAHILENDLREKIAQLEREKIPQLEKDIGSLNADLRVMKRRLDDAKSDTEGARRREKDAWSKFDKLEADVKESAGRDAAARKKARAVLKELEERAANAEKELVELKDKLEAAESKAIEDKQKIAELEESSILEQKLQTAEKLSEERLGEVKTLEDQLDKAVKVVDSVRLKLEKKQKKLKETTLALSEAKQKLEETMLALTVANENSEKIQGKMEVVQDELLEERRAHETKLKETMLALTQAKDKVGKTQRKLEVVQQELLEERRTNETMASVEQLFGVDPSNLKREAEFGEDDDAGPARKKIKLEDTKVESGDGVLVPVAGVKPLTYTSSYDTCFQNFMNYANLLIRASGGGGSGRWILTVTRASNRKMAREVLGKVMQGNALKSFFKPFDIRMTNEADAKGKKKTKENTMELGRDGGGLTNDLLMKVFNGLLELKVEVHGKSEKKLLFSDDDGKAAWALPLKDEEVSVDAANWYEAVGRLFLKAIISGAAYEAATPTLIPDALFNPCFLHFCFDRGMTRAEAGNDLLSDEDVEDALESILQADSFILWPVEKLIEEGATMDWATNDDADASTLVTHENHDMYRRKYLEKVVSTRKRAFEHMKKGFFLSDDHERHGFIPALKFFSSKQLRRMLCGTEVKPDLILSALLFVDGNDPSESGVETGHPGDSWSCENMQNTKRWLLEFISKLDTQECEEFLNYCAAVVRIPCARSHTDSENRDGHLTFRIKVVARGGSMSQNILPCASTCFRKLSLPAYTSYDALQNSFKVAFAHAGGYFGKE